MSDEHTPGPWRVAENEWNKPPWSGAIGIEADLFLTVPAILFWSTRGGEEEANARLVASAPKMLAIARRWAALDGGAWNVERYAREKAELLADTNVAIAEATGE